VRLTNPRGFPSDRNRPERQHGSLDRPSDRWSPMMIVITAPAETAGESETIRQMFENGLDHLHVRRPGARSSEIARLIQTIPSPFHSQIVLHSHYALRKQFPKVRRVHLTERIAKRCRRAPTAEYSLSVHAGTRNTPLIPGSRYALFGPIFPSLSKRDYVPELSREELQRWCKKTPVPVIGVGGICRERVRDAHALGLSGIALHSEIWIREPAARMNAFSEVRDIWRSLHEN
jgi:thiamine-phosphate pyrophosphorylase